MSLQGQLQNWGIFADGEVVDIPTIRGKFLNSKDRFRHFEDFNLIAGGTLAKPWTVTSQTGTVTGGVFVTGASTVSHGEYKVALATTTEAEMLRFDWYDHLALNISKKPIFECRVKISPDQAGSDKFLKTDEYIWIGLQGVFATDPATAATNVGFRLKGLNTTGDFKIYLESDDASVDNDNVDSGAVWVADTYMVLKIDLSDLSNVIFSKDGLALKPQVFNMSSVTANIALQPMVVIVKPSIANQNHAVTLDYVDINSER